jgi:DNA-binding MarR family transcriptional regulator
VPDISTFEVGQVYLELHKRLHRMVDEAMTASGLSLARCKLLQELHDAGPMNQAALASNLGLAPRSVTELVDSLERDKLAERTANPADRRSWLVGITLAGEDALAMAVSTRNTQFDKIFGALNAPNRAKLVALLKTISQSLDSSGETNVK